MESRHLDGDHTNNRLRNLKRGTKAENEADKVRHGTVIRGEKQHKAKLTEKKVRRIKKILFSGTMSIRAIAKKYGVTRGAIGLIKNGTNWAWVKED